MLAGERLHHEDGHDGPIRDQAHRRLTSRASRLYEPQRRRVRAALVELTSRDNLFPDIDYRVYAT
jgi:hypothetical protein